MDRTPCARLCRSETETCDARAETRSSRRLPSRVRPTELANAAMLRYSKGDDRAFAQMYRLLAPRLLRVCSRLAGTSDAEDLMQEVFLKIHRARSSFALDGNVMSWASTIARTTFVDRMRYQRRRPERATDHSRLEFLAVADFGRPDSASDWRDFESRFATLSENLRVAYWLVKFEGMSCAQTAALLDTSPDAIKQRVHRASELLKAELAGSRP
jgi:RNA polymerase sigma-70 factor (ECF subfamily)